MARTRAPASTIRSPRGNCLLRNRSCEAHAVRLNGRSPSEDKFQRHLNLPRRTCVQQASRGPGVDGGRGVQKLRVVEGVEPFGPELDALLLADGERLEG